jgi:hypothetical protein
VATGTISEQTVVDPPVAAVDLAVGREAAEAAFLFSRRCLIRCEAGAVIHLRQERRS